MGKVFGKVFELLVAIDKLLHGSASFWSRLKRYFVYFSMKLFAFVSIPYRGFSKHVNATTEIRKIPTSDANISKKTSITPKCFCIFI